MQIYSISLLLNLLISYWFLPSKIIGDFNKAFSLSKSGRLNSFHSVNNNNASAFDEADQASRFAELFGEVVTSSTKKNLKLRAEAEFGACDGKLQLAKRAKELGLDAVHDTVHEMAKDEARHGRGFDGLLARYFAD